MGLSEVKINSKNSKEVTTNRISVVKLANFWQLQLNKDSLEGKMKTLKHMMVTSLSTWSQHTLCIKSCNNFSCEFTLKMIYSEIIPTSLFFESPTFTWLPFVCL